MSAVDNNIDRKIHLVKNILDNVYKILKLLQPVLERMHEMEENKQYVKNGVFEKAASLFGEISVLCREIEDDAFPLNMFLEDLSN